MRSLTTNALAMKLTISGRATQKLSKYMKKKSRYLKNIPEFNRFSRIIHESIHTESDLGMLQHPKCITL